MLTTARKATAIPAATRARRVPFEVTASANRKIRARPGWARRVRASHRTIGVCRSPGGARRGASGPAVMYGGRHRRHGVLVLARPSLAAERRGRPPGARPQGTRLAGLTPQAKALVVAATAHDAPERVLLCVVPADAAIDTTVADVRFFLGAIEGIGDVALGGLVLPFPSLQVDPYRALTPHMRVSSARARALLAMATGAGAGRRRVGAGPAAAAHRPRRCWWRGRSACAPAPRSTRWRCRRCWPRRATTGRIRSTTTASTACAAASSMSTRPTRSGRSAIEFIGDMVESIRRFDPGHAAFGRDARPVPRRAGARARRGRDDRRGPATPPCSTTSPPRAAAWSWCPSPTSRSCRRGVHAGASPNAATRRRSAARARRRRCRRRAGC